MVPPYLFSGRAFGSLGCKASSSWFRQMFPALVDALGLIWGAPMHSGAPTEAGTQGAVRRFWTCWLSAKR